MTMTIFDHVEAVQQKCKINKCVLYIYFFFLMVRFDPKGPWKLLCYFTRDCMRTLRITVWAKADILGPDETRNEMKRVKCVRELREA